jgi:hypothetical protein
MYACIRRYQVRPESEEDLGDVGWRLGAALAQLPGFVATVAVDDGCDALITISLLQDARGLSEAEHTTSQRTTDHQRTVNGRGTHLVSGEVVAQKGL